MPGQFLATSAPPATTYLDAHRVLSVQEVPSANEPIDGVGTPVAAFVGLVQPES
jgi:hypothetical protein